MLRKLPWGCTESRGLKDGCAVGSLSYRGQIQTVCDFVCTENFITTLDRSNDSCKATNFNKCSRSACSRSGSRLDVGWVVNIHSPRVFAVEGRGWLADATAGSAVQT